MPNIYKEKIIQFVVIFAIIYGALKAYNYFSGAI